MLQFLPYALAAYGGYQGYKTSKGCWSIWFKQNIRAVTGATAGYYGGKSY